MLFIFINFAIIGIQIDWLGNHNYCGNINHKSTCVQMKIIAKRDLTSCVFRCMARIKLRCCSEEGAPIAIFQVDQVGLRPSSFSSAV